MPMAISLNAALITRRDIAPGLAVFRVAPTGWKVGEFKPGQFVVLGLPGSAPRCPEADPEETPAPADQVIRRAVPLRLPRSGVSTLSSTLSWFSQVL